MGSVMEAVRRASGVTRIYGVGSLKPGAPQYRGQKAYRVRMHGETVGYVANRTAHHAGGRGWDWSLDGRMFHELPEGSTKKQAVAMVKRKHLDSHVSYPRKG